jgi:capsular polysaccharide biosynthesis protein
MEGQKRENFYLEEEVDFYELCLILKKRFKLIAGGVISAVLITVVISFLLPPVYRGSFIIRVPIISENQAFNEGLNTQVPLIKPKEAVNLIENLDRLRKDGQIKKLSDALGISDEKIGALVELTANAPRDVKDSIKVVIDSTSPVLINDFKDGVLRFLNENQYAKKRISLRRASLLSLREEIKNNISEVEAVRKLVRNQIREDKTKELGFNPIEMDKDVIIFKQTLRNVENEIELQKGFEIVVEPVISDKPVKPKKALNVAIAGTSFLFLGILLAFLKEWAEKHGTETEAE